jgi:mannose-6-phosphate isomerase-like protein (cupin superfamily)
MKALITITAAMLFTMGVSAQPAAPPAGRQDALDPTPVDPAKDPDIGMFLGDWRQSRPHKAFGRLVVRDILTPLGDADPLRPRSRGAVLQEIANVSRATLARGATARGRMPAGSRATFYTFEGSGQLQVNGRSHELRDGIGFLLTPDFDFTITSTGKTPLAFYMRTEPVPAGTPPSPDVTMFNRWDNDRRIGAHWLHICNGGPPGMNFCTMAARTMPQPHSHSWEEVWLAVKGESALMLGKQLVRMQPGQAYKVPPTGVTAHSNLNMGNEPIQMIVMLPVERRRTPPLDFAQLENKPIDPVNAPDIDLFISQRDDAYPRIAHGNIYMRDMLTSLTGGDPARPIRKGAVLTAAVAVSHAMLEPGATAHPTDGDAKDVAEIFIVDKGSGTLRIDGQELALSPGKAFILRAGQDFRLTATGSDYLSFHVVTERLVHGAAPARVQLIDHQGEAPITTDWHNQRRPVVAAADGLQALGAISAVALKPMAIARPYSIPAGGEEIWIALDDADALIGKQLRRLPAGTAYKVPPTGITAAANINVGDRPARFLHILAK